MDLTSDEKEVQKACAKLELRLKFLRDIKPGITDVMTQTSILYSPTSDQMVDDMVDGKNFFKQYDSTEKVLRNYMPTEEEMTVDTLLYAYSPTWDEWVVKWCCCLCCCCK